jgi:hypothetical protein
MKDSGVVEITLGLGFVALMVTFGGCAWRANPFEGQVTETSHQFALVGTEKAVQIHYYAMLAAAKQMVETPDKSFHTERRMAQEKEYTIQNEAGSTFWQRVTANARAAAGGEK